MTRKLILLLASVLLVGVLIGWGSLVWHRHVYASTQTFRPFVMTNTDYGMKDGKEIVLFQNVVARRRDGGRAKIGNDLLNHLTYRRLDLPNGFASLILDALHIKSSEVRGSSVQLGPVPVNCLDNMNHQTLEGEEQLFGHKAYRIVLDGGNTRWTQWRLPEFQCEVVRSLIEQRADQQSDFQMVAENRTSAFAEQDPDPRMFADDSTYREMKPSDFFKEALKANGVTQENCPKCFADMTKDEAKDDAKYEQWQKP